MTRRSPLCPPRLTSVAIALCAALALFTNGCIAVTVPVLVAATVLPETSLPTHVDDLSPMQAGEGTVVGAMRVYITDDESAKKWRNFDPAADDVVYTIRFLQLDRKGYPITDRSWEADCEPDTTCPFLALLPAGHYKINFLRISTHGDTYGGDIGSIVAVLDYRFDVVEGQTRYLGRLSIVSPTYTEEGKPQIRISVADDADIDLPKAGYTEADAVEIALIVPRWKSEPSYSYGFVR